MTIDLTPIYQAVIAAMAMLITYYAVPALKNKLTANEHIKLKEAIRIAVTAAEQLYPEKGHCEAKKAYVVELLKEKGFASDTENLGKDIDAMIEAAVYQLKKG